MKSVGGIDQIEFRIDRFLKCYKTIINPKVGLTFRSLDQHI